MPNALSLRSKAVGGPVAEAVVELTPPYPQGRRRAVLLVHGFNVTEAAARASYDTLTAQLKALGPATGALVADLGGVYWPGDADLGLLSAASYPFEIGPARDTALRLAEYLETVEGPGGTPTEVYLVAHSLGARVTLELLTCLAGAAAGSAWMRGACLMAAAVPVGMVDAGGLLVAGTLLPARTLVLYSRSDLVLHWAFPLGETLAGEGFFPSAVGRRGDPSSRWTDEEELLGDDHGDYWGDPRTAVRVARFLGVPVPAELPSLAPVSRPLPDVSPLPTATIAARDLPARTVGA